MVQANGADEILRWREEMERKFEKLRKRYRLNALFGSSLILLTSAAFSMALIFSKSNAEALAVVMAYLFALAFVYEVAKRSDDILYCLGIHEKFGYTDEDFFFDKEKRCRKGSSR